MLYCNSNASKALLEQIGTITGKVFRSLESLLEDHTWLTEVWQFLQTWKGFGRDDIFNINLVQVSLLYKSI